MAKAIQPLEILEAANGFYNLAMSCSFQEGRIFSPKFVNMALACELYLKAIIQNIKSSFPHLHKLQDLYDYLDDMAKAGTRDEMRKAQANSEEARLFELEKRRGTRYERDVPNLSDEVIDGNVKSVVREASNLFCEWRYIFEQNHPYFRMSSFFNDFTIALQQYATTIIST